MESNSWWERRDALELISNHLKASTLPNGLVSQVTEGLYQIPFDIALTQLQTALNTPVYELQLNQRLKIVKPILSNRAKFFENKSRDACFRMFASICIFLDFTSQQFSSIIDNKLNESRRSKLDIALLHLRESISTENIEDEHTNSEKLNKTVKPKSSSTEQEKQRQKLIDNPDFGISRTLTFL
ncbi:unnamed protein product [Trichobilharzia regenti]|nr:unnamed protein product [Trichobilharzia regenti]